MLVEDEGNILDALMRLFRREGYQLIRATSAEEGVKLLETTSVDIVISDQRMPGMQGTEFLKEVKSRYPNSIRMILSGYAQTDEIDEALDTGVISLFIPKPVNEEDLRRTVRLALLQRGNSDPNP